MTLHRQRPKSEVGIRELHDHLSRYIQQVQAGAEIVVTLRGRRVARLVPVADSDPLAELRARGLIREPTTARRPRRGQPRLPARAPVSDLVADQRR